MATICKCCGKKIGVAMGVHTLSQEYTEPICEKCMTKIKTEIISLQFQTSLEGIEQAGQKLAEAVDQSDFTEEGKRYVLSYKNDMVEKLSESAKQRQKIEEEEQKRAEAEQKKQKEREAEQRMEEDPEFAENRKQHLLTTGYNFEGYEITSYIGILSGSVVLGTGFLSEFSASISDFLGEESNLFSNKLEDARERAIDKLIYKSVHKGGNALIGIDFDYITFSSNMIGVIASGTSVIVKKKE